eukprot:m.203852 g.203852  ORF g.203852 m.203852 type:complete len:333 (-) comp22286_c0_seq1:53-1051(-)
MQCRAQNPSWLKTMLRVRDPSVSLPYYTKHFGMTLIDVYDFPEANMSAYFLASLPPGATAPTPGTPEAHAYLWNLSGTCLQLVYTYGAEKDGTKYHPGNADKDGFGHIAFNVADVYASCAKLEQDGVTFKKKPDEGRMKGLAFAYDPDGYWVEIVKRAEEGCDWTGFNLSQTMLRIKDPEKSIPFYRDALGMTLLRQSDHGVGTDWAFSLYFLGYGEEGKSTKERFNPVLELTHNHGTEKDESFAYVNGNAPPDRMGFSNNAFLVDDVDKACEAFDNMGAPFVKKPTEDPFKGIAFVQDPDGYHIEICQRGGQDVLNPFLGDGTKAYGMSSL